MSKHALGINATVQIDENGKRNRSEYYPEEGSDSIDGGQQRDDARAKTNTAQYEENERPSKPLTEVLFCPVNDIFVFCNRRRERTSFADE